MDKIILFFSLALFTIGAFFAGHELGMMGMVRPYVDAEVRSYACENKTTKNKNGYRFEKTARAFAGEK